MALSLCTMLRELAHGQKCTILCTIHQPSAKIFSLFDTLILLQVLLPIGTVAAVGTAATDSIDS